MTRVYNFGAGPAMVPEAVLLRAKAELLDWQGTGVSVMEIGHRTSTFKNMLTNLEVKIRKLMSIPTNYKVLFLAGGGQGLFSLIPMNLTAKNKAVDYLLTGIWSERAAKYAKRYADVNIATQATSSAIPEPSTWTLNPNAKYAYYCPNETINGIRFPEIPDTGNVPLVADFTSSILSENIDVSKFGIIFASAQKNLGIAGITLVIIRDDLLDEAIPTVPEVFSFRTQADNNSILNTIPTFPVYMMDLVIDWVNEQGGVDKIEVAVKRKVAKLYKAIDDSKFYTNTIDAKYRSLINVPFSLPSQDLLDKFLVEAAAVGLKYLQGHVLVGGARASLYNAMPEAGVDKLIDFMHSFAVKYA
jgi:phosphoserine aminotransferase